MAENSLEWWMKLIVAIIIGAALFNAFAMPRIIPWWEVNGWIVITVLIVLGVSGAALFLYWLFKPSKTVRASPSTQSQPRTYFDNEGVKHTFFDSRTSQIPRQPPSFDTIDAGSDSSATIFSMIAFEISNFKPFRKYPHEDLYQVELASYLRTKFPNTKIEEQRGLSRPDIVIDDIAIEIKGPTRYRDLRTVADKLMRYEEHFKGGLMVVLFDLNVEERLYDDWHRNITRKWPEVKVIAI